MTIIILLFGIRCAIIIDRIFEVLKVFLIQFGFLDVETLQLLIQFF